MQEIKREIYFGDDLENSLKKGIDKLSNAVKVTMGPKGKLVLIQRPGQHPIVTKDGVTVAKAINLMDEVENLGAQIIKEAASRTADEAGDGTTTATVLAQAIYTEGLKMKSAGFDMVGIKQGIKASCKIVVDSLLDQREETTGRDDLLKVAKISANGEESIATMIVQAIESAGEDGHVIVEEAKGFKSSLTIVDGFQVERGFLSPYFVTDKNKMTCEFNKPLILMADRNFNTIHELMKPLELALELARPILVIANDIEGDAMQGLVLNRVKGALQVCAIKSPGFGGARHDLLYDLEAVIGGNVVDAAFDMTSFTKEMFGSCKKIIIHKNNALIVNGAGKEENIKERIRAIKDKLDIPSVSEDEKELLGYRIKQLSGGIAILRVGAATESELIERYDRVDDALHATRAALQEGMLPGGGVALVRAAKKIKNITKKSKNGDFNAGARIMEKACLAPFQQIITNSGKSYDVILQKVLKTDNNTGYDARNDKFDDMFDLGIVDPCKVVRCAVENATSAATMLLSAECSMIEISQK